ncbi:MAG: hypothetical protein ISN26_03615 [Betaproteobacteria bacterium AqS2]|uniref:Polynucleotide adenylyltransferase n=1 Tax=Candidatus Amphirhobacter heronislandensis TaxID=1732024 RepID=A0A930Y2R0_9GAMM|nr:hypothetical protein [Betaproteobacteria bacterium AqS2]
MKKTYTLRELGLDEAMLASEHARPSVEIVKKLQQRKHESYIVGGAVRDLLLGISPKDYDVATSATPEEIRRIFRRGARIIGRRFRLVHVRQGRAMVEVSTFRRRTPKAETETVGGLQADNTYGSPAQDALRRDMTINALMLDPVAKTVIDHVRGIDDIRDRLLRVIGDPATRYDEDPVRMIRILRLAAKLNCEVEPAALRAIAPAADKLEVISSSRLFEEFKKTVNSGAAYKAFELMRKNKLMHAAMPDGEKLRREQLQFVRDALRSNDEKFNGGGRNSLSVLLACMYWSLVAPRWREACAGGEESTDLLYEMAAEAGLNRNQWVTRMVKSHIMNIWEYQYRFERIIKDGRKVRFRPDSYEVKKALELFELRVRHGEVPAEDKATLDQALAVDAADVPRKRPRRRRPRRRAAAAE